MRRSLIACCLLALAAAGCQSPYHQDRGALFGGVTGVGVGAIVGDQFGKAGPGALVGAAVGAMTGSAVGAGMDEVEARNRAAIEAQLGRPVGPGAVSVQSVIELTHAGVNEQVIINHIRSNGTTGPLQANDLIVLQQAGVSPLVVAEMQNPQLTPRVVQTVAPPPQPVIVEQYHYGPAWHPYYRYHHHHHHRPRGRSNVGWSISVGN